MNHVTALKQFNNKLTFASPGCFLGFPSSTSSEAPRCTERLTQKIIITSNTRPIKAIIGLI